MSTLTDRPAAEPSQDAMNDAVNEVLFRLRNTMKPKARQKARASLEAYATQLETWEGCRLPANVTRIWGPRSQIEQARASEAQRQERIERAAAIRALIGRAF